MLLNLDVERGRRDNEALAEMEGEHVILLFISCSDSIDLDMHIHVLL